MQRRPPLRSARSGLVARRVHLHLVGKHEVGDVATDDRVLHRQRRQLGMMRGDVYGLAVCRNIAEHIPDIGGLECAATAHLRRYLTRDRQDRRTVLFGVVEPGEPGTLRPGSTP